MHSEKCFVAFVREKDYIRADTHTTVLEGLHTGAEGYDLKEARVFGDPMMKQIYPEGLQLMES